MNNSSKKLALNTVTSFVLQIVITISGFILPRLMLSTYGSEVNGLINSITQFLGVISLLDLGVGAVVQSALYKPLADNDKNQISKIYVSADKFFKRLAMILLLYVIVLMAVYPFLLQIKCDYLYIISLIFALSISYFAQYYFGIVNGLLLSAHQKIYIQNTVQICTIILNTVTCAVLIRLKYPIQAVKLTTSFIYLVRPLYLYIYVKRHYNIDKKISYTDEPIKEKWNGMAQHFAYYALTGTDNIVLTVFSTLDNVSVYSVYNIVITGVTNVIMSMKNGFQSFIGEMHAKKKYDELNNFFGYFEWLMHTAVVLIFGCAGILIVPFIKVYTHGITDAHYIQPLFAILITIANAMHCLRLPYNTLILAAGHYKQTQSSYVIATVMNIAVSIATVKIWGLIGVAIGTLASMAYQTVWMAWYDSKNIICWEFKKFLKLLGTDALTVLAASLLTIKIPLFNITYIAWIIQALGVLVVWTLVILLINYFFYRDKLSVFVLKIFGKLHRLWK